MLFGTMNSNWITVKREAGTACSMHVVFEASPPAMVEPSSYSGSTRSTVNTPRERASAVMFNDPFLYKSSKSYCWSFKAHRTNLAEPPSALILRSQMRLCASVTTVNREPST
ncbi:AAEL007365-PA [Aedes aegypti]|uniref:AAEL007365-PA n=1 Tax=Aedes aegypti TaxID=7159 RepID=Q172J1_AEDAE|nr:AAEL007365-PA [Aedes aegypti]